MCIHHINLSLCNYFIIIFSHEGEPAFKKPKPVTSDTPGTSSSSADSNPKLAANGAASKIATTNGASSKLIGASSAKSAKLVNGQKERTSQSVQKDPSATTAFKSLFTTSEKAKSQPKGNWVTYNPFYN